MAVKHSVSAVGSSRIKRRRLDWTGRSCRLLLPSDSLATHLIEPGQAY